MKCDFDRRRVTLQKTFDPRFWKRLKFFALVLPNNDIFPVRAVYNNQTQNIGVNRLTSDKPIWFAGPDVIASILLTGKIPRIEKAIRIVPHGKQRRLESTKLRGMVTIDPSKDDFFRLVIEQRKRHKSDKSLGHFLKILANAGSYGLFVELTPEKQKKSSLIKVFSGQESFIQRSLVVEQQGKWYFPPIASLITAGGRLLLAMLEKCVTDAGGSYLFCDTDSLCIVASENGGLVECHGGAHRLENGKEAIKVLSWENVRKIGDLFAAINPYDQNAIPGSILKIEDINFDTTGNQRQLYALAISAKRYAIYERNGDTLNVVDPKAHGLGYLYPPKDRKNEDLDWTFEAWDYLLREILDLPRKAPSWIDLPAMMRIVLSTPHVLQRLDRATRPYNFLFCPLIDSVAGIPAGVDPDTLTLITEFTKNREQWKDAKCINVFDGNVYRLALKQNSQFNRVVPQTFGYVLHLYPRHPESKSLAPDGAVCSANTKGLLQRASVTVEKSRYVGKETDRRWEQGEDLSLMSFAPTEYSRSGKMVIADEKTKEEMRKYSVRELMRRTGLSHHTLYAALGKPIRLQTLAIIRKALNV